MKTYIPLAIVNIVSFLHFANALPLRGGVDGVQLIPVVVGVVCGDQGGCKVQMSGGVVLIEAPEAFIEPPVSIYPVVEFVNGAVSSAVVHDASAAPSAAGAASSAL